MISEMIPVARRWVWRIDVEDGVGFRQHGAEPGSRLGGEREDAREGGIVSRRSGCRRGHEGRRVRCLRAIRPVTGRGRRQLRFVTGIGDVATATCRRDIGERQRDDEHQEDQKAPPGDSVSRTRPLERHDIGSGVGLRVDRSYSYRTYARRARTVRRRCGCGHRIVVSQPERLGVSS